jgi:hypothetical protein
MYLLLERKMAEVDPITDEEEAELNAERDRLRAELEKMRKFDRENELLFDEDGNSVYFEKTYISKMNIMGWVYDQEEKKYTRVRRIIHSKFWLALHNCIAHPMLSIYRPLGKFLHEYTAERMYRGFQPDTDDDEDIKITAILDA